MRDKCSEIRYTLVVKLDWAFQFWQAKNWKATNFGSKKYNVNKVGSYKKATDFWFCTWLAITSVTG